MLEESKQFNTIDNVILRNIADIIPLSSDRGCIGNLYRIC